ncbi:sphingosine-1-phosphate phosphatase 2 isoform X1 [Gadus morhua]|uniref:Sphingosine-1-phosphate phosphatase 2 n=1 Tax=Gadus morhua TaxID=8049 RepID=A0A8C5B3W6_GADMO|nr:sphingosine-1-phosphate phosphatase 2 isoform X1 [Gadus morhua]
MSEWLDYLNDSTLVARFQRQCGLVLSDAGPRDSGGSTGKDHPLRSVTQRAGMTHGHVSENLHPQNSPEHNQKMNGYKGNEHGGVRPRYEVRNWPLYVLFLLSAALGHEVFYITVLPGVHWHLDPFLCRRLVNTWTLVMYVGQVLKDLLKLPRPLSPPVVKLEMRVDAEYGLPSTHAMAATAIAFTLLLSATSRIQFQFEVGLMVAVVLSSLVCLSRLYTGMHSLLDVLCGVWLSAGLMLLTYPYWEAFDRFQLTSPLSPPVLVALPLFLSYNYPQLDHYSPTRADTTTILGVAAGCSVGYWTNAQLGVTFEPPHGALPVALPPLTAGALAAGLARYLVGAAVLLATRWAVRAASLRALFAWYSVEPGDAPSAARRREIEVPSKFLTYSVVGLVNAVLVNRLFLLLGIL